MTCYMCDKDETGIEHVPPRCLFPEKKDLPDGVDLRKELITVPSCDEHNTGKSKDDEYLLYLLVINIPSGNTARNHFQTKILRAINRNPGLARLIMESQKPVVAVDQATGKSHKTVAIRIDDNRLDSSLENISRGIYYNHFDKKWLGEIRTQPDFLLASLDPVAGQQINKQGEDLAKAADCIFRTAEYFGENPEVFKYQVADGGEAAHKLMRLHFYEGCKVSVFFGINS